MDVSDIIKFGPVIQLPIIYSLFLVQVSRLSAVLSFQLRHFSRDASRTKVGPWAPWKQNKIFQSIQSTGTVVKLPH